MNRLMLNNFICNILHYDTEIVILNWKGEKVFDGSIIDYVSDYNELYTIEGDITEIESVSVKGKKIVIYI